jgi:hypothetical protein
MVDRSRTHSVRGNTALAQVSLWEPTGIRGGWIGRRIAMRAHRILQEKPRYGGSSDLCSAMS